MHNGQYRTIPCYGLTRSSLILCFRSVALPSTLHLEDAGARTGRESVHNGAGVAPDWPLHPDLALQGPLLAPAGTPGDRSGTGRLLAGGCSLARALASIVHGLQRHRL